MRVPLSRPDDQDGDDRPDSGRVATADQMATSRVATSDSGLAVRLAEGAKGGLVATLAMTAYRLPISRSLPPTAEFWTTFVSGGDPDDHPVPAAALHLLYGTVGGVAFGLLAPIRASDAPADDARTDTPNDDGRTNTPNEDAPADTPTDDARTDTGTDDVRETARLEAAGLLAGVVYALALSVFGERVLLERLLDMDLEADERLVFHAGHVVYGLGLGTWFGSRTGDRR